EDQSSCRQRADGNTGRRPPRLRWIVVRYRQPGSVESDRPVRRLSNQPVRRAADTAAPCELVAALLACYAGACACVGLLIDCRASMNSSPGTPAPARFSACRTRSLIERIPTSLF